MKKILNYLESRMEEKSTFAAIVGGIPVASALPSPWCYIMMAGAIGLALFPTSSLGGGNAGE